MRKDRLTRKFGARLRGLREAAGLSQEQLGELASLHRNYVGGVERGEYNLTLVSIARLAKALKITPSELLDGIEG